MASERTGLHADLSGVRPRRDLGLWAAIWLGAIGPQGIYMMPLIIGGLATRFHLGPSQSGFAASIALSGACTAAVFQAIVIRTVSWRTMAMVIAVVASAAYLYLASHPSYELSLAALFCVGLGMGVLLILGLTLVGDSPVRARGIGFIFGIQAGISVLLSMAVSVGDSPMSDSGLLRLLAAATATALLVAPLLPTKPAPAPAPVITTRSVGAAPWISLALGLFAWGAINFANGGFWPLVERIAVANGSSTLIVDRAISISIFASVLGGFAAGALGDRMGRLAPLIFVGVLTAASVLVVTIGSSITSFIAALTVFGFVWNFGPSYQLSLVSEIDPSGRGMSLAVLAMKLAMAIAPACYGLLASIWSYHSASILAAVMATVSTVAFVILSRRRESSPSADASNN
jgi:predicted MFS family arabinose efflux permease